MLFIRPIITPISQMKSTHSWTSQEYSQHYTYCTLELVFCGGEHSLVIQPSTGHSLFTAVMQTRFVPSLHCAHYVGRMVLLQSCFTVDVVTIARHNILCMLLIRGYVNNNNHLIERKCYHLYGLMICHFHIQLINSELLCYPFTAMNSSATLCHATTLHRTEITNTFKYTHIPIMASPAISMIGYWHTGYNYQPVTIHPILNCKGKDQ